MFHSVVCSMKGIDPVLSNAALHYVAAVGGSVLHKSKADAEQVLRNMVQENFGPTFDLLFTDPHDKPCDLSVAPAIKIHIVANSTVMLQ